VANTTQWTKFGRVQLRTMQGHNTIPTLIFSTRRIFTLRIVVAVAFGEETKNASFKDL
jgi:hypothetical protein